MAKRKLSRDRLVRGETVPAQSTSKPPAEPIAEAVRLHLTDLRRILRNIERDVIIARSALLQEKTFIGDNTAQFLTEHVTNQLSVAVDKLGVLIGFKSHEDDDKDEEEF